MPAAPEPRYYIIITISIIIITIISSSSCCLIIICSSSIIVIISSIFISSSSRSSSSSSNSSSNSNSNSNRPTAPRPKAAAPRTRPGSDRRSSPPTTGSTLCMYECCVRIEQNIPYQSKKHAMYVKTTQKCTNCVCELNKTYPINRKSIGLHEKNIPHTTPRKHTMLSWPASGYA